MDLNKRSWGGGYFSAQYNLLILLKKLVATGGLEPPTPAL